MNTKNDDRRVRKTKKALRQGLSELLLKKNIKDISVRELTDYVDIHRGTFYLHYRDIYDLYAQIEAETAQEVKGILERYTPEEVAGTPFPMILTLIEYIAENVSLCRMMLSQNGNMSFTKELSDIIYQKCIHDWMALFKESTMEQREFYGAYVVSGCIGVLRKWLDTGMAQTPERVATIIEKITVQGMKFLCQPLAAE
ncbi:TetR/AcrR family transcriptional regulator [Merdimmobilis hominis]|jgi:AcrR family transcriptional regulator|uniref:TetR/AcrR family transcriptional regulator n=1 Tax=Merdimmobilis hominis TaxID=2897707 RepID=UPI0006C7CF54|nr:TetR/AcrR family transcriptional regulator [Merdimmobilis hominis]PWL61293.1 MAG: TetR/AcrR family transcriptional regulator [Oscillospiraceae bacterium]